MLHHHKAVHVLIPKTCDYVTLNSKEALPKEITGQHFGSALGGSKSQYAITQRDLRRD